VGLIIHEGSFITATRASTGCSNLGQWWFEETGLPLPLGGNVVRKDLGDDLVKTIARLLKESIVYALEHRGEALAYALEYARDSTRPLADRFVGMYVTTGPSTTGSAAARRCAELLKRAWEAGLVPTPVDVQFVG